MEGCVLKSSHKRRREVVETGNLKRDGGRCEPSAERFERVLECGLIPAVIRVKDKVSRLDAGEVRWYRAISVLSFVKGRFFLRDSFSG